MVVQLPSDQARVADALQLVTLRHLRLCEMLLLPSHEVLFFLLPTLKSILLIRGQGRSEAREAGSKWRLRSSNSRAATASKGT
jgi:hypothetical protein